SKSGLRVIYLEGILNGVANTLNGGDEGRRLSLGKNLRCESKDGVDELTLTDVLCNPSDLAFSDCVHRFVALNRSACALRRTEAEARHHPLLYKSMILFDDIVQVGRGPALTAWSEFPGLLQFGDRGGVRGMAIDVDHSWQGGAAGQC